MENSQNFSSSSSGNNASASNAGINGDREFPVGYRFCPTDYELIVFYLKNKISNLPLPHDKIPCVKISDYKPDDLAKLYKPVGDGEWYFFTPRDRKYPNGKRPCRSAGKGYWKATGSDKLVLHNKDKSVVGIQKSLVFYEGKARNGTKTDWIMHEFRMHTDIAPHHVRQNSTDMKLDDWVLCRIHYNKKKKQQAPEEEEFLDDQEADNTNTGDEIPAPNYQDYGNDQHHNQSVNNDSELFQDQDYGNDHHHSQSVTNDNQLFQDQVYGNDQHHTQSMNNYYNIFQDQDFGNDQHHNQSVNNDFEVLQYQEYGNIEYMMQFPQEFNNLEYILNSNNKRCKNQQSANYQLEKNSRFL